MNNNVSSAFNDLPVLWDQDQSCLQLVSTIFDLSIPLSYFFYCDFGTLQKLFIWLSDIRFPVGTECLLMSDETVQYTGAHHCQRFSISLPKKLFKIPFNKAHNSSSSSTFFPHSISLLRRVWDRNYNVATSFQSLLWIHYPTEFKFILPLLPLFTLFFFKLHIFNVCQYMSRSTQYEPYMLVS